MPVPDEQLPVVLPEDLVPDGSGNPLAKTAAFYECRARSAAAAARRETDTMDTFVDSSWYFLRYASFDNAQAMVDERARYWMPVDQYIGGIEHAILHLLYSRFWTKVMRDLALPSVDEPFTQPADPGHGAESHLLAGIRPKAGASSLIRPRSPSPKAEAANAITAPLPGGEVVEVQYDGLGTMSKSRNNGVDPQKLVERFGADTVRLFVMFTAPPEQTLEWSDEGVLGSLRASCAGCGRAVHEHVAAGPAPALDVAALDAGQKALRRSAHQTLAKVTDDIGRRRTFNTAIAAVMELLNALGRFDDPSPQGRAVRQEAFGIVAVCLSPIVPHVCHVAVAGTGSCRRTDRSALARSRCGGAGAG